MSARVRDKSMPIFSGFTWRNWKEFPNFLNKHTNLTEDSTESKFRRF